MAKELSPGVHGFIKSDEYEPTGEYKMLSPGDLFFLDSWPDQPQGTGNVGIATRDWPTSKRRMIARKKSDHIPANGLVYADPVDDWHNQHTYDI